MRIDRFTAEDVEVCAELEQLCFSNPWSAPALQKLLAEPYCGYTAKDDGGRLLGYISLMLVLGEVSILNLAVFPEFRRLGVGRALLRHVMELAEADGCEAVRLEVRVSNAPALRLYETAGFTICGRSKNMYTGPAEDGYRLEWLIPKRE